MAFIHKMFGSSKYVGLTTRSVSSANKVCSASTILTHFNGNPVDLRPYLLEERLPDGWEPTMTDAMGLTMMKFNNTVIPVEMLTDENQFRVKKE